MTIKQSTSKSNDIKLALGIVKVALAASAYIILFAIVVEEWPMSQARWYIYLKSSFALFLVLILGLGIIVKISPFLEKIIENKRKSE